jgi:colanic acid/amylovoran biosynthesis glycosyltransferase
LVEIKGHEQVLRALANLQDINIQYDIVGDGPLRSQLTALARTLGLQERVRFHGSCSEMEVRDFFAQAHLFALTSVNIEGDAEGQGLVLQEAQACGVPVIATRHGAFPEGMAPENHEWLVPERDIDALVAKLRQMISAHRDWRSIGRTGRAFVEDRYNIQALNERLVGIYCTARRNFTA